MTKQKLLIGNSFPMSLIRRSVHIEPCSLTELQRNLAESEIFSFWGHSNTLPAIKQLLNRDLTPSEPRPVLTLSENNKPLYVGNEFSQCWVLAPDYCPGFRPAIGEDVPPEKIRSWQCLKITFL